MIAIVLVLTIWSHLSGVSQGQLSVDFYEKSCPNVGQIVGGIVRETFAASPNIAPLLLRLHFHDCFVEGCDGSILVDNGPISEKRAFGHQGVGGFEVIERAKAELEAVCPGVVSCADIVALAAREAIVLTRGPSYGVEMGRRDGMVSNLTLAADLPEVDDSIEKLKEKFIKKGLNDHDLVVLSGGAHTIGTTACFFMTNRLYNFGGKAGGSDPSINPDFLPELKTTCPQNGDVNVRLAMDHGSGEIFDDKILQNIRTGFAVLQSDARLYEDDTTKKAVDSYFATSPLKPSFAEDFANAMVKMGRIGVLTGTNGTIRRTCSAFAGVAPKR